MGTDKCLSVYIHLVLLTKVRLLSVYFIPGPSGLGYAHEENENPRALQSAEISQPRGMDMCLHT